MVKNLPIRYTMEQMEEVQSYIESTFGLNNGGESMIAHEITSEYVHSDVLVQKSTDGMVYASFGMGAREMNCPREGYERAELVLFASPEIEMETKKNMNLAATVVNMTKYPFLNNTWFGTGHTVSMSQADTEKYGYDAFALLENIEPVDVPDLGEVHFLTMIPIYEDEREWIMENNTFDYLELLFEEFGRDAFYVDKQREHFIPDDEQADELIAKHFTKMLGIDKETYYKLGEYLAEVEASGEEITYEIISEWIENNQCK